MLLRTFSTIVFTILVSNQWTTVALAQQSTNELQDRKPSSKLKVPEHSSSILQPTQNNSNQDNSFSYRDKQKVMIPKSSAITTTFCSNVKFNQEQASSFPVTLSLARPLMDSNGNIIAPINSLVRAKIDATEEDDIKIKPKAVVIGGQYIPLKTEKVSVPALRDTRRSRTTVSRSFNRGQRGVAFRVTDNVGRWLSRTPSALDNETSNLLSFGLSVATGIAQGMNEPDPPDPEETKVLEIREGTKLIFPLASTVELPPMASDQNPYFANRKSAPPCQNGRLNQNRNQFRNNGSRNGTNEEID
ncbi:MAG: hypothetical protein BRC33_00585 [Cyanobacteria bacterium SW_9_44_58]|nr:MAG: hypothetical protein BRC33_00585 [Cyanobacteria bacterium SW_9_44_58]